MIGLLSSIAMVPLAMASAGAQTGAPAASSGGAAAAGTQAGGGAGGETRSMSGTTTPAGPAAGGVLGGGLPTIRLSGLRFTMAGDLTETYTTNAAGINDSAVTGYSGSDLITTVSAFFGLHDHTPRIDLDVGYTLSGLFYANNSNLNRVTNQLNALTRAILIPDRLLFTASAFATPLLINGLGPQGVAAINSGLRDTYGYTLSPDLTFRFGQFARSDTVLTQSGIFFTEPGGEIINQTIPGAPSAPDSVLTYGASESIASGPDFYRLNWILNGTGSKTTQPGLDFTVASGTANIRYAFSRAIIVTSLLGYQSINSTQVLTQTVSGAILMGGLQLAPGPDLELNAQAGSQFGSASYQGDLRWQIGAFTSLVGALADTVTTPASRIIGNLANLGVNGNGDFIDTNFQVNPDTPPASVSGVSAFNPGLIDGTAITPGIIRYRTGTLSLVHISGRTQYRLTGFHSDYETISQLAPGLSSNGNSTGVAMMISRNMTPLLTGAIDANYSTVEDFGGKYNLYQANINLNYLMSPRMQAYFLVGYSHRSSDLALAAASPLSADFSEAHVTIGLHRQFH